MKYPILIFILLNTLFSFSQSNKFIGIWEGNLQAVGTLKLVFEVSEAANKRLVTILKSPQQTKAPLPTDTTYLKEDSIFISAKKLGIQFKGLLTNDSTINGIFIQGAQFPLQLKKVQKAYEVLRPQTPKPPFNYNSIDTIYFNADKSLQYGATITYPNNPAVQNAGKFNYYPTVILITGSGQQDRDETIFMHKPFAVIADYLTGKGFAVLRVDDRGIGKSTGNFTKSTSADFAKDVEAALDFIKTLPVVDTNKLGLIGHSEGGMIAPLVASKRKEVKFIVLLAGPGVNILQVMSEQIEAVGAITGLSLNAAKANGAFFNLVGKQVNLNAGITFSKITLYNNIENWAAKISLPTLKELSVGSKEKREKAALDLIEKTNNPWFKYFLSFDPVPYLQQLSCAVLALNGEKDIQVLPVTNTEGIKAALKNSKSKNYEVKILPGLNHLFQTCQKCSAGEYGELEETFSVNALKIIGDWLVKTTK